MCLKERGRRERENFKFEHFLRCYNHQILSINIVWYSYLTKDQLRLKQVQNRFLSDTAFILKIDHPPHDYLSVRTSLNIPTLASCRVNAYLSFITSLFNGSILDLLSSISVRVPVHFTRNHSLYLVSSHHNIIFKKINHSSYLTLNIDIDFSAGTCIFYLEKLDSSDNRIKSILSVFSCRFSIWLNAMKITVANTMPTYFFKSY
ncbi:Reverse transcriptase domain-containing protein [Aphis craccivora]|uniref:Reverse transcriptase domain-containing protein n=1 Tax=Aphis craccivora TaxID=307492 RepID=A0A6G0YKA3_APHCR|nr:Reverse transcriptase domain-containing protein [Aphis craccivora]